MSELLQPEMGITEAVERLNLVQVSLEDWRKQGEMFECVRGK